MIKPETLIEWRQSLVPNGNRRTVTKAEAAERLMVYPRSYKRWETIGCPNDVMLLAMSAIKFGLSPFTGSRANESKDMISPEVLAEWRARIESNDSRRAISKDRAARLLMVNPRTYKRWETIGCTNDGVRLAMTAVQYDLPPFRPPVTDHDDETEESTAESLDCLN